MRWLIAIAALVFFTGCNYKYSEGNRVGTLYKFSKKGLICKTWEGTLKTGFMGTGQNGVVTSEEFNFSVTDPVAVDKINDAIATGKRVEISYEELIFTPPCSPQSGHRVTDIKVLE